MINTKKSNSVTLLEDISLDIKAYLLEKGYQYRESDSSIISINDRSGFIGTLYLQNTKIIQDDVTRRIAANTKNWVFVINSREKLAIFKARSITYYLAKDYNVDISIIIPGSLPNKPLLQQIYDSICKNKDFKICNLLGQDMDLWQIRKYFLNPATHEFGLLLRFRPPVKLSFFGLIKSHVSESEKFICAISNDSDKQISFCVYGREYLKTIRKIAKSIAVEYKIDVNAILLSEVSKEARVYNGPRD